MEELKFWLGMVLGFILVFLVICVPMYFIDKSSCYDRAMNYKTNVDSYSFVKNYCFVNMGNKVVNLENYRDTNEVN
jgi:hypothetical protein